MLNGFWVAHSSQSFSPKGWIFGNETPEHRRGAIPSISSMRKPTKAIVKSVRSALGFFNEMRKQAIANGLQQKPPSFEEFAAVAKNVMEASKRVDSYRLRNTSLKESFDPTWSQKTLNYSTRKQLRLGHESLVRRY